MQSQSGSATLTFLAEAEKARRWILAAANMMLLETTKAID